MGFFDKIFKEAQKKAEEKIQETLRDAGVELPQRDTDGAAADAPPRAPMTAPQPTPSGSRAAPQLPATGRFAPGDGGRVFRVARTVAGTDPGGRRIFRTGVGVSTTSQSEAEAEARANAQRLLEDALAGREGTLGAYAYHADRRLEPVVDSVRGPSGEVARITVNGYGSLVINASAAMFVDVDLDGEDPDARDTSAPERLQDLVARRPDLGFRAYRTLAGWRYLCTSATFDPASAEVQTLLRELGSDEKYVTLCRIQKTFRARLTPKPWRADHKPLTLGSEGIDRGELQRVIDATWRFATARSITAVGSAVVLPQVAPVLEQHDLWTQALTTKPLA